MKSALLRNWIVILIVTCLVALPFAISTYYINIFSLFLIMGILALSLDLIWGYAGLLSFGQAAFFGLGGYTYAVTAMNLLCDVKMHHLAHYAVTNLGGTTYIPILAGMALPAALALILGYLLFYGRVSGVYFAIITLCVALILQQVVMELVEQKIGNIPIGGYNGITYVPSVSLGIPFVWYFSLENPSHFYYFVLFCSVCAYFVCSAICSSPFGRVITAIRDNELRTESFSYDTRKYKIIVFAISGALAGLSGILYCSLGNYISPWAFDFVLSAEVIIWVLIGGKGTLIGAFLGAMVTQFLENILSDVLVYYWLLIMGAIFIVIVLFFPQGILGIVNSIRTAIGKTRSTST